MAGLLTNRCVEGLALVRHGHAPNALGGQEDNQRQDGQGQWHPVGCEACAHTGYQGRTGIYELMSADEALRDAIHRQAPEAELREIARSNGLRSMREDGERLVALGHTSMEELLRVTRD